MAAKAELMRVGGVELLVETTPVAGTESTSKIGDAAVQVIDAFDRVKDAIVEVAAAIVEVIEQTGERAARPDHLEVQFGLKVAANGNVIVAGVSAEATVTVNLVYDAKSNGGEP
jgi:hypothetical protein